MADSDKRDMNQSPAPGPGEPDWDKNAAVLRGEVDPKDPNKGSNPVDEDKKGEATKR